MKALRSLKTLTILSSKPQTLTFHAPFRLLSTQLSHNSDSESDSVFDSSQYTIPAFDDWHSKFVNHEPTWDQKYRERVDEVVFRKQKQEEKAKRLKKEEREVEDDDDERKRILARALLDAAFDEADDEIVREEDQKSLAVGVIGPPNAGKTALTNFMVGTKVSAVSRKTNTTTHEVLGVMTEGDTQICFFDTPGLSGYPYKDVKARVESAWSTIDLYDVLLVIFDAHRHLTRPDQRVVKLIQRLGSQANPKQKRVLCMNKVDLIDKKKDLLQVLLDLGTEGLWSKAPKSILDGAVKRPWDEDPLTMSEEVMKGISLEVVRERLLDHVHQEIPYGIEHRLMDWKDLKDGSLRIEQHFITPKVSQKKILVGKKGSKIGRIGIEANEELRSIFKRDVHLVLQVRLK